MRRLVAVALVALVLLAGCTGEFAVPDQSSPEPVDGADVTVEVLRVVDGDTLKVAYPNGTEDTVRLVGVDTPEVHVENDPTKFEGVPDDEDGRACLDRHGENASSYAKERLDGQEVGLAFDPNLDRRGYYDRLLAYVLVDSEGQSPSESRTKSGDLVTVNYDLVAEGYARTYDSDFSQKQRFRAAEDAARENGTGLWACASGDSGGATETGATAGTDAATATPTGDGVVVAEIDADAEGNDNENLNDEYVVLANRGDEPVPLDGWTVSDEAGKTYEFGNCTLAPGERVTLHTGSGEETATDVYWGKRQAVWNNDGDTVTVRDANGTIVAERSY